jgi:transcriptional regulator MraZ
LDQQPQNAMPAELPSSILPARIDDKGRIKLPADFFHFFEALPERKVYVTSTDGRIAEIYPISTWKETEKFYIANRTLGSARRALFTAGRLGSNGEIDSQGRLTIHSTLRAELGLDNQELHLQPWNQNRLRILSAARFAELVDECKAADLTKDEDELLAAGLP